LTLEPTAAGFREGEATVEVWARDDFWRPWRGQERAAATFATTVDVTPPPLEVAAATPYILPGGAGLVVVRAGDAVRADARVGSLTFPTFPMGPQGTRVGFFALPYDIPSGTSLSVTAADEAGNAVTRGIPAEMLPRRFRRDTIEVSDAFLNAKVPELLPQRPPGQPLVEGFLVINRDQRKFAEAEKRRVALKTADKPLWEGAFVQPRNTKVFSNFVRRARTAIKAARSTRRCTSASISHPPSRRSCRPPTRVWSSTRGRSRSTATPSSSTTASACRRSMAISRRSASSSGTPWPRVRSSGAAARRASPWATISTTKSWSTACRSRRSSGGIRSGFAIVSAGR